MNDSTIVITGIGMISSVGLHAVQSCASIRAGISGIREWEGYFCSGEPGSGALDPLVCARVMKTYRGVRRVTGFMASVVQELMHKARLTRRSLHDADILFSLPEHDREENSQNIITEFFARSGIEKFRERKIFTSGQAGGLLAIQEAMDSLAKGAATCCVVIGADSYLAPETLVRLDEEKRLKSAGNQDGFIPGEAAAALLLESYSSAKKREVEVLARIETVGSGKEKNIIGSDNPSTGEVLSGAIRNMIKAGDEGEKFQWVVCDLNGESYRAREWGYVRVRLRSLFEDTLALWHPADCIGDVGAASGVVLATVTARAFQRGYAPAERALLWASSDGGDRASVVVKKL
jgi:3-oxoacyl-[acyl-carrier-protein] synthase-1